MKNKFAQTAAEAFGFINIFRFFGFRKSLKKIKIQQETIQLPDGDTIELCYYNYDPKKEKPLAILLPGVEGSYQNRTVLSLAEKLKPLWNIVIVQYRGCTHRSVMKKKHPMYGDHEDIDFTYKLLQKKYPDTPIAIAGTSFGGSLILGLLCNNPQLQPIAAASISTAANPALVCKNWSSTFDQSLLKKYKKFTIQLNKNKTSANKKTCDLDKIKSIYQYMNEVTYPELGYASDRDFIDKTNIEKKLQNITTPTVIIHSDNDKCSPVHFLPENELLNPNTRIITTQFGAHSSFVYRNPWDTHFWTSDVISQFFNQRLADHQKQANNSSQPEITIKTYPTD